MGKGWAKGIGASFCPEGQPAVCSHCFCCWLSKSSFGLGRLMSVGLQELCWVMTAVCSPPPPNFWMLTWWEVFLLIVNKLCRLLRKLLGFNPFPFLRYLKYGNTWSKNLIHHVLMCLAGPFSPLGPNWQSNRLFRRREDVMVWERFERSVLF